MRLKAVSQWLDVPSTDPDDARRRKLLNILLLGVATIAFLGLLAAIVAGTTGLESPERVIPLSRGILAAFLGSLFILILNRYGPGWLASSLFLLLLTTVVALADEPEQVVNGRSLFLFTIPILMASVILRPWASFAMAGLSSLVISFVALTQLEDYAQGAPPIPTMLGFFAFALVSWLSARSLENALEDLRALNRELDHLVEVRTRELQQANLELAKANEHLREMDRLKSRFLSMISHDLRTPLGAIQGFAEMLQAEVYGPLSDKQGNAIDRITVNARQLLHLVNDLLDRARIEAGQLSLHARPFSPTDLVEDVRSTMSMLAESKGIALTTSIAAGMPDLLRGDEKRVRQILVNLVNNAIKFTEEGGVHLRVYWVNEEDAPRWAIEVADTGPGIPKEDQKYLFEPFRRVDDSMTREHKGVGLGLSIVKQLAELMEGEVLLDSEVGQGSTFTVILPLVPAKEKE